MDVDILLGGEVVEVLLQKGARYLHLPLAADVVEDDVVAVLEGAHRLARPVHQHQGLQGLVLLALAVGLTKGLGQGIGFLLGFIL